MKVLLWVIVTPIFVPVASMALLCLGVFKVCEIVVNTVYGRDA